MHFDRQSDADGQFSANTLLWLAVAAAGLLSATLCGLLFLPLRLGWLYNASRDALALGFALPALMALVVWKKSLTAASQGLTQRGTSQANQLGAAVWMVAALAVGLAQGYVDRAFLLGEIPPSLSLSLGAAALSPLAVWHTRPNWLRYEGPR